MKFEITAEIAASSIPVRPKVKVKNPTDNQKVKHISQLKGLILLNLFNGLKFAMKSTIRLPMQANPMMYIISFICYVIYF